MSAGGGGRWTRPEPGAGKGNGSVDGKSNGAGKGKGPAAGGGSGTDAPRAAGGRWAGRPEAGDSAARPQGAGSGSRAEGLRADGRWTGRPQPGGGAAGTRTAAAGSAAEEPRVPAAAPDGGAWTRRGAWLEVMPGRAALAGGDAAEREAATDRWLLETVRMPAKLHARLRREGGVEWSGDRLRLALFPEREAGIEVLPHAKLPEVLYEDDFCLVVHKPAGMGIHPDGSGKPEATLDHLVAAHYAASGGGVAVRHIHRLDKDTTGPVLYAKNEFAQLALDEAMRDKTISRRYAAIVQGIVPSSLKVIDAPIGRDRHHAARRRVSPGGQSALTRITGLTPLRGASLLRVQLETGRTHQIRVHLSHMGHPLYGDELYEGPGWDSVPAPSALVRPGEEGHGGRFSPPVPRSGGYYIPAAMTPPGRAGRNGQPGGPGSARQALHGESLAFTHPWTGERLDVSDPWPEDMKRLLQRLSGK